MKILMITALVLLTANLFGQKLQTGNATVDSLINAKDTVAIQQKLKILGNGSEKDMITVMTYYTYDKSKKDSVMQLLFQRYPKGDFVFNQSQRDMYKEDNAEKREKILIDLKQKYPDRNMDQANSAVANAYSEARNPAKAMEFIGQMKNVSSRGTAIAICAQEVLKYDPATAESFLRPEIERLYKLGPPHEPRSKGSFYAFANLYGDILVRERKYGEALPFVKDAYEHNTRRDASLSKNYGLVMAKSGQYQEALPVLQKLVDDGKASADIRKVFSESYENVNPGKSGSEYLRNVNIVLQAKMEKTIARTLIDEPAPNIMVTDVHGNQVHIGDFKGKIIILDFWATWCGPCKASFPSMQRIVNKYNKDTNIKFFFIHTLESSADPLSEAKRYLNTNNYSFDLYLDKKDAKTKKNEAVAALGINAIPTKVIIDSKGNMRFKVVGFTDGNDDDAVTEVSAMIEIVKKNS